MQGSRVAFLGLLLFALPAAAFAGEGPVKIDRFAYVEDERVAVVLHTIFETKRFDEVTARRLMPLLLVDGLAPEEQDLYYEIVGARFPVSIRSPYGPVFVLPPPDGAARDYMGLLKTVVESTNLQATLETRWLTGGTQMKDLVDISTFGVQINNAIAVFVQTKLATSVTTGSPAEGFAALKGDLDKVRAQLAMTDIDTEKRGKALFYNVVRDMDGRANGAIPDEFYVDMKP